MNVFDVVKEIIEKKTYFSPMRGVFQTYDDEIERNSGISSYMVNRILSMNRRFVRPINEVQIYSNCLTKAEYLRLLASFLPREKYRWQEYIKASSDFRCQSCGRVFPGKTAKGKNPRCPGCGGKTTQFPSDEILKHLSRFFRVSTREAKQYRTLLSDEQIIEILKGFGEETTPLLKKMGIAEKAENQKKKRSLEEWA